MKSLSERVRKDMQDSENLIKFGTKGCPQCKSPHEKNGGCNHMTCGNCRCDWCWICNADITGKVHDHYSEVFASCRGLQFTDMRTADVTSNICYRYLGSCGLYIFLFFFLFFKYLILLIDWAILIGTVLPTIVIGFCCYLPVGILLALVVLGLYIVNSSRSNRLDCVNNLHECWGAVALYIPFGIIAFIWWLASVSVILGPLLLYLFGMLVTNTFDWSDFSNDDFSTTFTETIFHVPIFLSQNLIPDSS